MVINGNPLGNLRYADYTRLVAIHGKEMAGDYLNSLPMIGSGDQLTQNYGTNKKPAKQDGYNRRIYLSRLLANKEGCEAVTRWLVSIARTAISNLIKIWKDRHINKNTKTVLGFWLFAFGSESWTIKSSDRWRLDAFEMWCWRRMLRIAWTEKIPKIFRSCHQKKQRHPRPRG